MALAASAAIEAAFCGLARGSASRQVVAAAVCALARVLQENASQVPMDVRQPPGDGSKHKRRVSAKVFEPEAEAAKREAFEFEPEVFEPEAEAALTLSAAAAARGAAAATEAARAEAAKLDAARAKAAAAEAAKAVAAAAEAARAAAAEAARAEAASAEAQREDARAAAAEAEAARAAAANLEADRRVEHLNKGIPQGMADIVHIKYACSQDLLDTRHKRVAARSGRRGSRAPG